MRHLLLIATASVLLAGIGCFTDDAQKRRDQEAEKRRIWGDQPSPDQLLGIEPMPTPAAANKTPAATPANAQAAAH